MADGVQKHILDNGLTVLLKEVHSAPIISWWVMYRVGSRNEPTGKTGISHWVEHMLFKGTEKFPSGVLDRAIDRLGGTWNAQTFIDYTAYYETLPAEEIALALEIEADRMQSVAFTVDDVESERTVILSERAGLENSPSFWLGEAMNAASFYVHGYHHEIVGDRADLQTITRDDLEAHYRGHYVPANAVAVAVGAFDSTALMEQIRELYGSIPAVQPPPAFNRPEPEQIGERRIIIERPGKSSFVEVAYHVPAANHPDWFAMEMLNSILCGADSLGGGGIDNKTSRLYKALVNTELAAGVDGSMTPTVDPFLYTISITVRDGRTHAEAEAALYPEIDRLRATDITEAELTRTKKQVRALFAYATERVTSQAFWLAFAESFDSYTWFETYLARMEAVTLEDLHRVANTYLRPQNRIVGWLVPVDSSDDEWDEEDEAEDDDF